MKEFHSFADFSDHLLLIAATEDALIRKAVEHAAHVVEKEAKSEIGTYQDQIGPFIAWPDLSDATKRDRVNQGYTEDEPLLRSGQMRDSIGTAVSLDGLEAQVGSNEDKALWQELGTEHIPPRSFLGGAMARKVHSITRILGSGVLTGLLGAKVYEGRILIGDTDV